MNKWFAGLVLTVAMCLSTLAASRDDLWRKVDEAIQKGLPRTAITNLEPIIAGAIRDQAYGEAAKAVARKIVLEGNVEGNKPEEKITRMEAQIARSPGEIVPLLRTIQANWYWHYFQQNRWRFMRRTATAERPGQDFTTWDLPRLFSEIDRVFGQALSASDQLKKTPVSQFDALLDKGTVPDTYRPTLYDFVGQEALKFYTAGEQAGAKPEEAFEISADSPIFGSAADFLAWQPATTDTDSPKLKAVRLHQELLRFHEKDQDPTPFIDLDIARLQWGSNVAFGPNKNARYKDALQAVAQKWADHELSAYASYRRARVLHQEGQLVEARALAQRTAQVFPESIGGRKARNLITEIEAKSAGITTERVWNQPWPKISVRYRNVSRVYFRAVARDWESILDNRRQRFESFNEQARRELLAREPTLQWSAPLPPTPDFKLRLEELPAPGQLKPGFYFLLASHNEDFSETDNQVSCTEIWVSELALVVRPREGLIEGFVLEANSGEPISGAEVQGWYWDRNNKRAPGPKLATDENGFFSFKADQRRGYLMVARHRDQIVASPDDDAAYEPGRVEPHRQVVLFTDRALYRPGQTIQYKGIVVRVDAEKDDYEVQANRRVTVVLDDPNGKEVAKAEHSCNDYGSFNGSFNAPRDRLMGRYQIRLSSGEHGQTWLNVEEYKRPKFQVTLAPPKAAPKLNDAVSVQGKAEAYTGAAVDGAKVKWRVVREVRWPEWWGWWAWRRPQAQGSQEIAHGTATTATDGTFPIQFTAAPDPQVSEKDEASFSFSIHADVTDSAGETRSAQRGVQVGFVALRAGLTAEDWQTDDRPVELTIRTTTLDGEAQIAEGQVKIHRLKPPPQVHRPSLDGPGWRLDDQADDQPDPDLSNPNNWELADVAAEKGFTTDAEGKTLLQFSLPPGAYRALLETQDRFGKKVTARLPLQVLQPNAPQLGLKIPHLLAARKWILEPGQEFLAVWGTGYESGRAFIEFEHRQRIVEAYWTKPGQTQQQIRRAVTEAMRGGFTLHVTRVRENRAYLDSRHVEVPWSNKQLELHWEHFVSKLTPGQKETWTCVIQRPPATGTVPGAASKDGQQTPAPEVRVQDTEKVVAEMVAALYDESLDQYLPQAWLRRFGFFRLDHSTARAHFVNRSEPFRHFRGQWRRDQVNADLRYRQFPDDLVANFWGYGWARGTERRLFLAKSSELPAPAAALAEAPAEMALSAVADGAPEPTPKAGLGGGEAPGASQGPDLSQVTARRNLNETAFFFPQLVSDSNGVVRITFTMPEALTQWRFLGFAHDRQLRSGYLENHAVTAKDLMVQPNPPRFLREGDAIEFTVKVSNQSPARQEGKVRLTFGYAQNEQPADADLGNTANEQAFDIPTKESRSFSWRIQVPDGCGFLTYKAVGSTGKVADGEEGYLPVLSRRILVTESLPLPIRGPATNAFEFDRLVQSGRSETLRHQNLLLQMVSNPSWYAVMALPYLMEFPHECTEQTFNRLYANALARFIANRDPKIRRVFDQWKGTPALDSPLEKNQDLKAVMLEETPWVRQAQNESQARKNVGVLFDENRLNNETERTLRKLSEEQLGDGSWPWFPGGRGNDYITLYITTGFGRLRHLGTDININPAVRSLERLDNWMDEHYRRILARESKDDYVPSTTDALYLYGRSFFLKDKPVAKNHQAMADYFLGQARQHWLKVSYRQSQGHLALALNRWGGEPNRAAAQDIMRSIKERSVANAEMGMFWRETELSWWWYRAPIETQALMIEALDEVLGDKTAVEDCRVWLLKQKQTQDWKTTKATADAVYALLLRGQDILASDKLVEVSLGGQKVGPEPPADGAAPAVEAGTGFYERRFGAGTIKPELGHVIVKKVDPGVAWGSLHWQYLEEMTKVTPYEGTPLKLKKSLYTKVNTPKGPVLTPVQGPLQVGDQLVVRIELRVDRDMEYVHLKDQRGSGTEPVNVLSGYRYQDGLAYYETTRDAATHFFIDYLPKGTYVFEYSTRVQHRGQYQTGLASIQCMYAPEFNSHSESFNLIVR